MRSKISLFALVAVFSGYSALLWRPFAGEIRNSGESVSVICEKGSPEGIRIWNPGVHPVSDIKILRERQPDFTSIERILEQILPDNASDEQKTLAIFDFLTRYRFTAAQPPPDETEPHDPVKYFSAYGYGICDDHAKVFYALLIKSGIRARICGVKGHTIAEAFYDNSWRMFDPDYKKYYRYPGEDRIISFEEVLKDHDIIVDQNGNKLTGILKNVYSSGEKPSFHERYPLSIGHKALFLIQPGGSVTFYKKGRFGYYGDYNKSKSPPYSNAIFTWDIDLSKEEIRRELIQSSGKDQTDSLLIPIRFSSPFVGVRLDIQIFCQKEILAAVLYKNEESAFKKQINASPRTSIYSANISSPDFQGQYNYVIYLKARIAEAASLEKVSLKYTTQCAPNFCPYLNSGHNKLTVFFKEIGENAPRLMLEPVYISDN